MLDQREQIIQHLRTEIAALEVHLDSQNNLLRSLKEQLEGHESREVDERRTQVFRRAARDILDDKTQGEFRAPPKLAIEDMGAARVTLGRFSFDQGGTVAGTIVLTSPTIMPHPWPAAVCSGSLKRGNRAFSTISTPTCARIRIRRRPS